MTEAMPLDSIELAITVDELLLWDGTPVPRGYTAKGIVGSLLQAFAEHELDGVYAYPHTAPIEDDPANREVIEMWCDAGHHVGNHTHCHACLNWVDAGTYCDDIKRAEEVIGDLVERAPIKTFRYTMDMSGQTEAKRGIVEDFLRADGYTTAPITAWFGDFAWTAPYQRAVDNGDDEATAMLRQAFIDAAIEETAAHAKATREMFGAPIPYLWLIHATPIAQDVMSELLQALKNAGATLVPFADAVGNVVHRSLPPPPACSAITCSDTRWLPASRSSAIPSGSSRSSPRRCPRARTRWPCTTC
jgi:Polysaccharide deacetylase